MRLEVSTVPAPAPDVPLMSRVPLLDGAADQLTYRWRAVAYGALLLLSAAVAAPAPDKPEAKRGYYRYPEAHGRPADRSVHWRRNEQLIRQDPRSARQFVRAAVEREAQGLQQQVECRHPTDDG